MPSAQRQTMCAALLPGRLEAEAHQEEAAERPITRNLEAMRPQIWLATLRGMLVALIIQVRHIMVPMCRMGLLIQSILLGQRQIQLPPMTALGIWNTCKGCTTQTGGNNYARGNDIILQWIRP